jgi:hypothetical protein
MSSLKDSIALLESDLVAEPPRINVYHDLPFAIMRYDPTEEWQIRWQIKLLTSRLGAFGKEVHTIPMSELLWSALEKVHQKDDDEGLEAVIELEKERGFVEAQQQVTTYLSSKVWVPLWDLLEERLASISPENSVVLAFLHSDGYDGEIGKKGCQKELRQLLQISFQIELLSTETLSNWRVRLGRHVLLSDLFAALKKQVPASLSSVTVATSTSGIDACVRLARTWRNRTDVRDSYVAVANKVEQELGLGQMLLPVEPLQENETFLCIERALMVHVESALLNSATSALLQLAKTRLSRFWADVIPPMQARWALISSAAEVLIEADRVGKAIKKAPTTVLALVKAYADDEEPWCLLDTHHRNMESRKYNFEFGAGDDHHGLDKLITKAEQRYTEVGSELAKHFVSTFQKAKHPIKGLAQQRDVFDKQVKPLLGEGKVAYVWVDALRFEMARELSRLLKDDFKLEIQPAIGTIPTITEIGMAALLPKANVSAKVVAVGGGKLALEIGGKVIKDRKDRVTFLTENAGVSVFDAKLEDLLPNTNQPVEVMVRSSHLFIPMPDVIREDMAFLDRIHFYIPGWEMPKMKVDFFTNHYGFVVDYLAEALRELRKHTFTEVLDRNFSLGSHLKSRDVKAVRKTVSGLVKLIYPNGELSKDEVGELVELSLEGRRRVKEQLKKMGSFEFHQTSFSLIDNETREEKFVGVPEQGGRDMISLDPLAPGSVYTSSVDDHAKVGLYRLEVGCSPGTGKLKIAGGVEGVMRESINRAFAYLMGQKVKMGTRRQQEPSRWLRAAHRSASDLQGARAKLSEPKHTSGLVSRQSTEQAHPGVPCEYRNEGDRTTGGLYFQPQRHHPRR